MLNSNISLNLFIVFGEEVIHGFSNDPWCINNGDLNVTRFWDRGGVTSDMERFSEVTDDLELRDLPLEGGTLYFDLGVKSSMSRLNYFLVSNDWECHFSGFMESTLARPVSIICPSCRRLKRGDRRLVERV